MTSTTPPVSILPQDPQPTALPQQPVAAPLVVAQQEPQPDFVEQFRQLGQQKTEEQASMLLARLRATIETDPKLAAEARAYGLQFGTNFRWTIENLDSMRQLARYREQQALVAGKLSQAQMALLERERDATVARDEIANLGYLERLTQTARAGYVSTELGLLDNMVAQGVPLTPEQEAQRDALAAELEKLPKDDAEMGMGMPIYGLARYAGQFRVQFRESAEEATIGAATGAAAGSFVPGLGTLVGAKIGLGLGFSAGMLATTKRSETGAAYRSYREMGYDHESSAAAAAAYGWTAMGIEAIGTLASFARPLAGPVLGVVKRQALNATMDAIARPTKSKIITDAVINTALGVAGEGGEEAAQQYFEIVGQQWAQQNMIQRGLGDQAPATDFERGEAWSKIGEAAIAGAATWLIPSAGTAAYRMHWDAKRARQAADSKDTLSSVNAAAAQQKLRTDAPDLLREFLATATRGTDAETIYFDARRLVEVVDKLEQQQQQQTRKDGTPRVPIADQLERVAPGLLGRARTAVGDVTIPLADFGANLAGTPLGDELLQHGTLDPEVASPSEAAIAREQAGAQWRGAKAEQMRAEADKLAAEDNAIAESRQRVKDDYLPVLMEGAGYTRREANTVVEMVMAYVTTTAKRLGMLPHEFVAKYPLPFSRRMDEAPASVQGEMQAQQEPPPDAGVFDAANPPAPLDGAARGPVVMAVMTYDGKVYYDRNATMHGELADRFPEIADSIIDGGFIRDGQYVMGMSDGGYSVFEGDEDMVARARMFTEQVNSRGAELRSQEAVERPASPIPMSALNVLHSDSKLLARPEDKQKKTKAVVAEEIRQVALAHWGVEVNSKMLEKAHDEAVALRKQIDEARAADAGADVAAMEKRIDDLMRIEREITANLIDEAIAALRASNRNAADWYTTAIEAALAAAAVIHPELADDAVARQIPAFANEKNPAQAARFVLRSALAITSQNNTVADNTKYAEQVYANFVATGLFNAGEYGSKKGGINGNLILFNRLLPKLGSIERLEAFARSEYTVRQLEETASKVLGRKVKVEGLKDDIVNGSAVFGPKIGQGFLQNLLGNFFPVTIDLWMRRTWGRLTGDVVGEGVTGKAGIGRLANFITGMRVAGKKLPPKLARLKVTESVTKGGVVKRTLSEEVATRVENDESLRTAAAKAARAALKEWDQIYRLMRLPITPAMRAEAPLSKVLKMSDEQRTKLFDDLVARLRADQKKLDQAFDKLGKKELGLLDAEWRGMTKEQKKPFANKRDLWMSKRYAEAGRTTTFERADQLAEFNNQGSESVISELTPLWASAAKTIKANLEPIDIPSPADRRVISRVVNEVRKGLAAKGLVVTNADVQAILWYPEKDLWSKLQGDKDNDLNKSYDDEFLRIAAERGLGAEAQAAIDAVRARRAGGEQVGGAVGVDGADDRGADRQLRGRTGQAVPGDGGAKGESAGQVGGELRSQDASYRGIHRAPSRNGGAPLSSLTDIYPDDVYGPNQVRYYGVGDAVLDRATFKIVNAARNNPGRKVTVYRAVPAGAQDADILPGDWVTVNLQYAIMHGESALRGDYRVIERTVIASDLFTDGNSIHEWGWDPQQSERRSRDSTPRPLFSALERAIASTPPGAMSARQWSAQLDRLVRTGAVKEQERFWSGIDEWLNLSTDEPGFVEFDDEGNQVRKMSRAQYLERLRTDPDLESRVEPEPDSGTRQISRGDVIEFLRANKVEVMSGQSANTRPDSWVVEDQDLGILGYGETEKDAEDLADGYIKKQVDAEIAYHVQLWDADEMRDRQEAAIADGYEVPDVVGPDDQGYGIAIDSFTGFVQNVAKTDKYKQLLVGTFKAGEHLVFWFADEQSARSFWGAVTEDRQLRKHLERDHRQGIAVLTQEQSGLGGDSPFSVYSAGLNLPSGVGGQAEYREVAIVYGGVGKKVPTLFNAPEGHAFPRVHPGPDLNRNRLAHYRASTRQVNGEDVMFVEEVQTDWGQAGRDRGFRNKGTSDKADAAWFRASSLLDSEEDQVFSKASARGGPWYREARGTNIDRQRAVLPNDLVARLEDVERRRERLNASRPGESLEGPFVTKTDDWVALALKHIVMDAAKRGQRQVVFVNGEQAAAMFDLSSSFDSVAWNDADNYGQTKQFAFRQRSSSGDQDTVVDITVKKDGRVIDGQFSGRYLSDVVGGEIADYLLKQWNVPNETGFYRGSASIKGIAGGEGMHTFYGNQDGLQSTPAGALQTNKNGEPMPAILPKVLRELAAKIGAKVVEGVQVDDLYGKNIALELTDETMRVLTEEGMPLFSRTPDRRTLGSFSPSANRITLYRGNNRSTWLHEFGHYWLEVATAIAGEADAPAEVVNDLGVMLNWLGVQATATQSAVDVWRGMDLEARRKHHERFAYHFEIFLARGEAPAPELHGVFERIGAWIREVYRGLVEQTRRLGDLFREEFGEDLGVLSPEARRVMERIFAADEDIERAAVEREVRTMFQTREEAIAAGMSEAAWDELQAEVWLSKERAKDELLEATERGGKSTIARANREVAEMEKEQREVRKEIAGEVAQEVAGERVERARLWLRRGQVRNSDGTVTQTPEWQKLDRAVVKSMLGIGTDKPKVSEEQFAKLRGLLSDGGQQPDELAAMVGYDSGEQLVSDLIEQPTAAEMVDVRTDARMRREHPEFFDSTSRRNRIERAIANDMRRRVLANELLHLQRAVLTSPTMGRLADAAREAFDEANRLEDEQRRLRDQAREIEVLAVDDENYAAARDALRARANKLTEQINRLRRQESGEQTVRTIMAAVRLAAASNLSLRTVREMSPRALNAAAARMARETMQALKAGEFLRAVDLKRRQLVLTEMARQAADFQDELRVGRNLFRRFAKDDEALARTHTMPLIYLGRAVLAGHGLRDPNRDAPTGRDPMQPAHFADAMRMVREMNESLAAELERDVLPNMMRSATGDFRDLTVEQFRQLRDNMEMLWERSRAERTALVDGRREAIEWVEERLLAAPGMVPTTRTAVGVEGGGTAWDKVMHELLAGKAARKRIEHWAIQMDGGMPGMWHKAVFQRIADAETRAEQLERTYVTRVTRILQRLVPMMRSEPIVWRVGANRTYTFGQRGAVLTGRNGPAMAELFMAVLHAQGNLSNKEKLLLDPRREWGTQSIDPMTGERTLDSSAWDSFFADKVRDGTITKEFLDAAQEIGDVFEEMRPILQAAHVEAFGYPFEVVEPLPFTVAWPDGTTSSYRGWYMPAKADRMLVQDADLQVEDMLTEARTSLAQTPRGMTMSRDPNTFRALSLQLSLLPGHIRESARFAAMGPAIVDVQRLLNRRAIKARIDAINPQLRSRLLAPWVKNAAMLTTSLRDESDTPTQSRLMRRLDRLFTYVTMFGNVINAAQNPLQLFPASTVLIADQGASRAMGAMLSAAAHYSRNPRAMGRTVRSMSPFMDGRGNNEVRDAQKRVQKMLRDDQNVVERAINLRDDWESYLLDATYVLQTMTQHIGDQITWKAAYSLEVQKHDDPEVAERLAVAYADSVVRRTQGSLRATDKSASEVTTPMKALLTKFSGFFVQMFNLMSGMMGAVRQEAGSRNRRLKYLGIYLGVWGLPFALSALLMKAMQGSLDDDEDKDGEWWDDLAWDILVESQVRPFAPLFGVGGRSVEAIVNIVDGSPETIGRMPAPAPFALVERGAKAALRAMDGKPANVTGGDIVTLSVLLGMPVPLPKQSGYLIDAMSGQVDPTVRGAVTGRAAKDEQRR